MGLEDIKKLSISIYQDFYREVNLNQEYVVNLTDNDHKCLDKFVEFYCKKINQYAIGPVFLVDYVEFAFDFWRGVKTKFGEGTVYLNWVFGKKGIERYEKWKKVVHTRKLRKDISRRVLAKYRWKEDTKKEFVRSILEINKVEESEKERFKNKDEGFIWCIQTTTLYNHKSKNCLSCRYSIDCKEVLKTNYLKLYNKRGYND